ncbi:MAG: G5 domain-containing protein [Candidatus Eremiobacteraeota bacterium]|nr:G5 domain-containing protein [Candidatus Eremiobacteraeota bacterium]
MIGRGPLRITYAFAIAVLTAAIASAGFGTSVARASDDGTTSQTQATPSASPVPSPTATPALTTWIQDEKHVLRPSTVHRYDDAIAPGTTKIVSAGTPGERDLIVRYTRGDDGSITRWIVASHVTRKPRPRIVAIGVDESAAIADFEAHGVARMGSLAHSAMLMVATAYTADCAGCGGITAIGRPAGHGIVAVDPRVIPLGTHLFIAGYGAAIAGDTGGAIRGLRIDLGFDSLREAMLFGRRQVTVYRLK